MQYFRSAALFGHRPNRALPTRSQGNRPKRQECGCILMNNHRAEVWYNQIQPDACSLQVAGLAAGWVLAALPAALFYLVIEIKF